MMILESAAQKADRLICETYNSFARKNSSKYALHFSWPFEPDYVNLIQNRISERFATLAEITVQFMKPKIERPSSFRNSGAIDGSRIMDLGHTISTLRVPSLSRDAAASVMAKLNSEYGYSENALQAKREFWREQNRLSDISKNHRLSLGLVKLTLRNFVIDKGDTADVLETLTLDPVVRGNWKMLLKADRNLNDDVIRRAAVIVRDIYCLRPTDPEYHMLTPTLCP